MLLGCERIRSLLFDKQTTDFEDRLIISPVLEPEEQLKGGNASIDLRLGHRFTVARRAKVPSLDRQDRDYLATLQRFNDAYFAQMGDYFVLHPRQFVMGETLEWVHLPRHLVGDVVGRSSWARDGLIIATANVIHPNYSGIITLELTNVGEIPIYLYPGLSICQLLLSEVDSPGDPAPALTTFAAATKPQSAEPRGKEKEIIQAFKNEYEKSKRGPA
ncbi:MAG: dCTP deaminase [Candidatus Acidiferrales bacterium]